MERGDPFTALAFITQLYQIEKKAKAEGMDSRQRYRFRQKHALPVLTAFKKWLDEKAKAYLPKSEMAKAIGYVQRQWDALVRYTEDGDLDIDNNAAERALRCVAVGRKNWMFVGNDDGGRRAAIMYSLIASCQLHGIDPFHYLRDVFRRIPAQPADALAELTPMAWAAAQAEASARRVA